jgi:hypothetical protein
LRWPKKSESTYVWSTRFLGRLGPEKAIALEQAQHPAPHEALNNMGGVVGAIGVVEQKYDRGVNQNSQAFRRLFAFLFARNSRA